MGVGDPLWEEEELQVAHRITLAMLHIHYILVAITMATGSSSRDEWEKSRSSLYLVNEDGNVPKPRPALHCCPGPAQVSVAASDGKLGGALEQGK